MKTCTYCGHSNEDEVTACAGCGESISSAEATDPILTDPAERLEVVTSCRNAVEANLLKMRLEAADIEACVPEEFSAQIFWNEVTGPFEGVTVRVKARDLEAARKVLAETGGLTPPPLPPNA